MKSPLSIVGMSLLVLGLFSFFLLLDKTYRKEGKLNYARLGVLLSLALVFGLVESFLPDLIVPGVKLGLSNVVVLIAIYVYGSKEGLLIALLKAVIVSFFNGTFLSMGGIMSLTGSLLSAFIMILMHTFLKHFSPIGVSSLGALAHMGGQLLIAHIYLGVSVWSYAPLGMALALATGILTGIISTALIKQKAFLSYLGDNGEA